jgi:hypothetical protein
MSIWFKKNLGDAMLAGDSLEKIEALFISVYGKADSAKELAVFIRHESEGRLHCEVIAFFSPDSVFVAREFDADPCERPSKYGLSLLVGSAESWLTFFPVSDD